MRAYRFEVVNVFAESTFGGNPLAVFPDATGLSDAEMLAITEQFNLSETTFLTRTAEGAVRVRIWTPGFEMDFAGHPTLGSAAVASARFGLGTAFELVLNVGKVPVRLVDGRWELRATPATVRPFEGEAADAAAMLGLPAEAVAGPVRWVKTGTEQLLVPVRSEQDVARARPVPTELFRWARNAKGEVMAYVFALAGAAGACRFFWEAAGIMREDPGTGSACANLGAYLNEVGAPPGIVRLEQGRELGRLNVITLRRDEGRGVYVSGRVLPLMEGELRLPA